MSSMNHVVIDVSSDEEQTHNKVVDYPDWLVEVLEDCDEKPKSIAHQKSDPTVVVLVDEGEDDDCIVLDDDPYKTTTKEISDDSCGTDEVLVLGQKGEIACRDFPHPRHACAKYPFESTAHQKFCEMCHCYVCDIRAPCLLWSIGISGGIGHCHANDKEKIWKNQRESIRAGKMLPGHVSKLSLTTPQLQRVSQASSIPLPPQNKFGMRSCATSTRVATCPNKYLTPAYPQLLQFPQNPGLHPNTPQVFLNPRGSSYNGHSGPLGVSSHQFKLTRRSNRGVYRPENTHHNIAQGLQYTRNATPIALQGNPQRTVTGYNTSTVAEFHNKVYPRHYSRNIDSGNVQTSAVPSETSNPLVIQQQQQQQSGISNHKVLSEFEDWLMDNTTLTDPVCPLPGQDDGTTFTFDFETFLE